MDVITLLRPGRNVTARLCFPILWPGIYACSSGIHTIVRSSCQSRFPALRFDFYGCGDSSGEHEEAHLGQWLNDVEIAIGEIQRRNRAVNDICLMGLRMGATLSAMAAVERGGVEYLVLWNPIIDGSAHQKELERLHREMLRFFYVDPDPNGSAETSVEIMAFAFSQALLSNIETIDLLDLPRKPANQVLLLDSVKDSRVEQLGRHLESLGSKVYLHHFDGPPLWLEEPENLVVPNEIWNCAVTWLSEVSR